MRSKLPRRDNTSLLTDNEKRLAARIVELERNFEFTVEEMNRKINILSQALRVSFNETKRHHDLIQDLGLDVPERLRPRR